MEIRGYIDKEKILNLVTEEQIFSLVFGYEPEEFDRVVAPYRQDNNPGCWFERDINNKLCLRDFAYGKKPLDCFETVKITYGLDNFYSVLEFIHKHLIQGKKLKPLEKIVLPRS